MERLHLLFLHEQSSVTHTAVHHVRSCGCRRTHEIQVQMKTRLLQLSWRLFLLIFGLFSEVLTYFLNAISWSKQLMRSCDVFPQLQMQYRASAGDKIKIEPALMSFMVNTPLSKMVDQNEDFIVKENCKSRSLF